MHKFVHFDAVEFLNSSKNWRKAKRKLQREKDSITELKSFDNSPIRSGKLNDSVANVAAQRERIQREIDRIELYQKALKYGRDRLSEEQNDVIDAFFFAPGMISKSVNDYGSKHAMCRTDVYKMRREALEELSRIISNRFL